MKGFLTALLSVTLVAIPAWAQDVDEEQAPPVPLEQTIVKKQLEEGVTPEAAIDSMKLRANMLNMPLVAELPLSEQLEAMGEESRRMEIFQFCDPVTAKNMVEANIDFAAYLPCRIALIEDAEGNSWLVMVDLDRILAGAKLPEELQSSAIEVRDALNEIMQAGASGDL